MTNKAPASASPSAPCHTTSTDIDHRLKDQDDCDADPEGHITDHKLVHSGEAVSTMPIILSNLKRGLHPYPRKVLNIFSLNRITTTSRMSCTLFFSRMVWTRAAQPSTLTETRPRRKTRSTCGAGMERGRGWRPSLKKSIVLWRRRRVRLSTSSDAAKEPTVRIPCPVLVAICLVRPKLAYPLLSPPGRHLHSYDVRSMFRYGGSVERFRHDHLSGQGAGVASLSQD